jgi:dipeptidyl aminopeptidase/acylaminoacyl peptidase
VSWFIKAPFEDPQEYALRSPITYVRNIQTPIMFILGDEDWRTPASAGGEQLFRALKYLKRPTVMIRFPDETHELSRSGKPWHSRRAPPAHRRLDGQVPPRQKHREIRIIEASCPNF